jgi:hypothetical protein
MAVLGICYGASRWTTSCSFLCWPFSGGCGIDLLVFKGDDTNARFLRVLHHDHNSPILELSRHPLTGQALSNTPLISSPDISFDHFSSFRSINIIITTIIIIVSIPPSLHLLGAGGSQQIHA